MNAPASPRRIVHLAVGGFPVARVEEIVGLPGPVGVVTEIFVLTEANAREALEKIFSANAVTAWGELG